MSVATTYSRAQLGINAPLVTVEADITAVCLRFVIVGLPETAVKESKDRVKAALSNAGFHCRLVVSPSILPQQIYPSKEVVTILPSPYPFLVRLDKSILLS